jgi:hypothetical protein
MEEQLILILNTGKVLENKILGDYLDLRGTK